MKHVDEECPKTLVACPVPMCAMSGKIERGLLPRLEDIRRQSAQIASLIDRTERIAPLDMLPPDTRKRVARERADRVSVELNCGAQSPRAPTSQGHVSRDPPTNRPSPSIPSELRE